MIRERHPKKYYDKILEFRRSVPDTVWQSLTIDQIRDTIREKFGKSVSPGYVSGVFRQPKKRRQATEAKAAPKFTKTKVSATPSIEVQSLDVATQLLLDGKTLTRITQPIPGRKFFQFVFEATEQDVREAAGRIQTGDVGEFLSARYRLKLRAEREAILTPRFRPEMES